MTALARLTRALDTKVDNIAGWIVMPTLARFAFAAVLLTYFWRSANTKIGDSFFSIDFGAYAQVLPRVFENVGFDASQIGFVGRAVVAVGTYSEFILPALIVVGLLTRLAALGMIGFVFVQSYVDLFGHNAWDESV
ncbi:MAG: DoxX family membrane protein, partial [Pseudomonadota bacterium]